MKFVHIADMHFDMPFTLLSKNGLAEERRIDQRKAFQKMINYIKENNIDYLLISGDLYEHEYVRKSTIEYINQCFKQIPNTKIYIAPGNHDPYLNNSYYNQYEWNENVHIFTKLEKIEESNNINIYGYGFTNFYSGKLDLPTNLDNSKINLLIMHADLDGASKQIGEYNPILKSVLENTEFDYIALGHIHKNNLDENKKIVYPGSTIAGGFDELGKHGMVVGNIKEDKKKSLEFIVLDDKEFIEKEIDISQIHSKEEIIETINNLEIEENKYYKILFTGTKNIEIDTNELIKYVSKKNIIKLKDKAETEYNIEKIATEQSLKGIFVKELLSQMNNENKEQILESIKLGLNLM